MNHYVYRLTCPEGFHYVGCRSTQHEPEDDVFYQGSGSRLKRAREMGMVFTKEILCIFDTREEALDLERDEVDHLDPWSLNAVPGGRKGAWKGGSSVYVPVSDRKRRKTETKRRSNYGKPWSAAKRASHKARIEDRKIGNRKSKN